MAQVEHRLALRRLGRRGHALRPLVLRLECTLAPAGQRPQAAAPTWPPAVQPHLVEVEAEAEVEMEAEVEAEVEVESGG